MHPELCRWIRINHSKSLTSCSGESYLHDVNVNFRTLKWKSIRPSFRPYFWGISSPYITLKFRFLKWQLMMFWHQQNWCNRNTQTHMFTYVLLGRLPWLVISHCFWTSRWLMLADTQPTSIGFSGKIAKVPRVIPFSGETSRCRWNKSRQIHINPHFK